MSNPNLVGTVVKLAVEDFDVAVDFTLWMATGDTITSYTVKCYEGTTDTSATMIGTTSDDGASMVRCEIKAGTAGVQYLLVVTAHTDSGDTWVAHLRLIVN